MTTTAASKSAKIAAALAKGFDVSFHVSIMDESTDEQNGFWFEDQEDLLFGLRRKLGIVDTEGLLDRMIPLQEHTIHAACDPTDEDRLIVAGNEHDLYAIAFDILVASRDA